MRTNILIENIDTDLLRDQRDILLSTRDNGLNDISKQAIDGVVNMMDQMLDNAELKNLKPNIIVVVEGGIVQSVLTGQEMNIDVVDYDVEGSDEEDLTNIPQLEGKTEQAIVYTGEVGEVNKERIDEILKAIK